jgi:hypothetical protein
MTQTRRQGEARRTAKAGFVPNAGGARAQAQLWADVGEPAPTFLTMRAPGRPMLVVSLGMGRDSVAMLILLFRTGIRPDLILFADTRSEKVETYLYLTTLNRWLARVGFPRVTVIRRENTKADDGLEYKMLRLGTLPSIAFNNGSCSEYWKQAPQKAYVSKLTLAEQTWKRNRRVVFAIGYEADECKRVKKAVRYQAKKPDGRFVQWYPLVEAGMTLADAINMIEDEGLPVPMKSACFFCSSSQLEEIEWLERVHPGQFIRALVLEARALPGLTKVKGLGGRAYRWRDLEIARKYLPVVDAIVSAMPPPEREKAAQPSEALRRAIERVMAIDDDAAGEVMEAAPCALAA